MFEYGQCEEVRDKAAYDVNQYIDKMMTEDIKLSELIIEGKCQIHYRPGF